MNNKSLDDLNDTLGIDLDDSTMSLDQEMENSSDSLRQDALPSNPANSNVPLMPSPDRNMLKRNIHSQSNIQPRTRQSINMRGGGDPITQSQGIFHLQKSSDPSQAFGNMSQVKHEYVNQKSNQRYHMKYNPSEKNSQANSFKNVELHNYRKTKTSNVYLKEMQQDSPRQDFIDQEQYRNEGLRTPTDFKGRGGFSRRGSERFFPKRSNSSVNKFKGRDKDTTGKKRESITKYESAQAIQENKEISKLRGRINILQMQLSGSKDAEMKMREELELMKRKNGKLREQLKELKKNNDLLLSDKNSVTSIVSFDLTF